MTRRPLALAVALLLVGCATGPGVSVRSAATITTAAEPTTAEPTTAEPTTATAGDGIGDSLFPALGNPGIDVTHYEIDLSYDPQAATVAGTVGIDMVLTEDREEITLDALGPVVAVVMVDDASAVFEADEPELRITLPQPGRAGDAAPMCSTNRTAHVHGCRAMTIPPTRPASRSPSRCQQD